MKPVITQKKFANKINQSSSENEWGASFYNWVCTRSAGEKGTKERDVTLCKRCLHTPCAEEPSPHNRQPCSLWVRRPVRGWTGREGRKPTEERGCKYVISLVYVCLHPNMWGPSHMWSGCYRLFPTPFATSWSLLLLLCYLGERQAPWGSQAPRGAPWLYQPPSPPASPVILISYRICH